MATEIDQLHVLFFRLMAQGHILPTIDMVRLFTARGVKTSIITTTHNAQYFTKTIEKTQNSPTEISLKVTEFPAKQAGLPEGFENLDLVSNQEHHHKFFDALSLLQHPLSNLMQELRPHAVVADMFFPWATALASKYGVPRLIFHGTSFFSMCAMGSIIQYNPHKTVSSDNEKFVLPGFPDEIKLTRMKMPQFNDKEGVLETDHLTKVLKEANEAEGRSYGVVVNSFYELEPAYANHYIKVLGRKAWHIGPVSLCNKEAEDKGQRGKESSIDKHECLKWLNAKNSDSVVYICFGSLANLTDSQLMEIAMGLEASEQQFIWVVKRGKDEKEEEDWLPKGFEKRMEGKGLIIRGWAPQVLILDHEAVGGFVTHCGWNSTLEGVTAGVPMVTWPLFAEQFFNEKLVTQVLKIGVPVGAQQCVNMMGNDAYSIKKEAIENSVRRIMMVSEEAKEMRSRAKALGEMARRAMEKGGSSYSDLNALIEELKILSG
ncbi:scopoletin glucosyltransferase-like [Juglans regia]|uniref:Glycosyltransferase n=1 Tax=Juglans regia TaxID=51240 RepID=A0A2I4EEH4_JUGRE|nr:scopoletin glucosyltransferase-like [Juglans regia]